MSQNWWGSFIPADVPHIAPLTSYIMMMRCHVYKGTTSSLCTKIRAEHVEPGRSVLKLQQHQRSHRLDTHAHTLDGYAVYTLDAHTHKGEKPGGNLGERWLYEQHSSEIPRLKAAEAAESLLRKLSQTSVALWRKICQNVDGNSPCSGSTTTMVRIFRCMCTYVQIKTRLEETFNNPCGGVGLTHQRIGCS